MTRLLLVRHAQSTWNAQERWQGWADPPLSALGERQAAEAATRLAGLGLGSAVASDLERARRTAEILADALSLGPPHTDPGLRERDVGDWAGHTSSEVDERWPGVREAWRAGKLLAPPGGEPNDVFAGRVLEALERVVARPAADAEDPVLVVTHGGVIRVLLRHLGAASQPVGLLAGYWFQMDGSAIQAGDRIPGVEPG